VLEVRNRLVEMIQAQEKPPVEIPEEKKTEGLKLPPSRKKKVA
jgi:hypothetical protein